MSKNKLIKYKVIAKNKDNTKPLKHVALFKISKKNVNVEVIKPNAFEFKFSIPEEKFSDSEIDFIKSRLIMDWNNKQELLDETNRKSMEITGIKMSEFRKNLSK